MRSNVHLHHLFIPLELNSMHQILTTKVQLIVQQVNIDHRGYGGPYKGRDAETGLD